MSIQYMNENLSRPLKVPQGAVLNTLLFNIMISELLHKLNKISSIKSVFFADSLVFWT